MNFVLPNKVYDILTWVISILIPASVTLLKTLAATWGWDIPVEAICTTITAVGLFLGVIFQISKHNYKNSKNS